MILAEALNLRADLQKRIAQVKERINDNVKVQEGDEPIEAPQELFKELDDLFVQLQEIIYRINKTNMAAVIDGKTLTEWIAARDVLKYKIAAYRGAINNSLIKSDRYSRNEIRFVRTIDAADIQKKADKMAKEYRELDIKIQQANWATELA